MFEQKLRSFLIESRYEYNLCALPSRDGEMVLIYFGAPHISVDEFVKASEPSSFELHRAQFPILHQTAHSVCLRLKEITVLFDNGDMRFALRKFDYAAYETVKELSQCFDSVEKMTIYCKQRQVSIRDLSTFFDGYYSSSSASTSSSVSTSSSASTSARTLVPRLCLEFHGALEKTFIEKILRHIVATGRINALKFTIFAPLDSSTCLALQNALSANECALHTLCIQERFTIPGWRGDRLDREVVDGSNVLVAVARSLTSNQRLEHVDLGIGFADEEALVLFFDALIANLIRLTFLRLGGRATFQRVLDKAAQYIAMPDCRLRHFSLSCRIDLLTARVLDYAEFEDDVQDDAEEGAGGAVDAENGAAGYELDAENDAAGYELDSDDSGSMTLSTIRFPRSHFDSSLLFRALAENKTITTIDLENTLCVAHWEAFCGLLAQSNTIRDVSFSALRDICHQCRRRHPPNRQRVKIITPLTRVLSANTLRRLNLTGMIEIGLNARKSLALSKVFNRSNFTTTELNFSYRKKSSEYLATKYQESFFQRALRRNRAIAWRPHLHESLLQYCLAMMPLQLPPYILLWIHDWLPLMHLVSHVRKIQLIEDVVRSCRKVLETREESQKSQRT